MDLVGFANIGLRGTPWLQFAIVAKIEDAMFEHRRDNDFPAGQLTSSQSVYRHQDNPFLHVPVDGLENTLALR